MSHWDSVMLNKYLAPLVGGVIREVRVDESEGDAWPQLTVVVGEGDEAIEYELEIGADVEGNGPGHIFGLPYPED